MSPRAQRLQAGACEPLLKARAHPRFGALFFVDPIVFHDDEDASPSMTASAALSIAASPLVDDGAAARSSAGPSAAAAGTSSASFL
ncbi:hypothetical protein C2W62_45385 [Candidatus Entotheonella serta]|nr:hypothetical protein C2W62_45385 [Candidatus Entotheonella serta]